MSSVVFIRVFIFSPMAHKGDLGVSVPCHQPRMLNVMWIVHLGKANGPQFKGDDKFYLWMSMDQNVAHQALFWHGPSLRQMCGLANNDPAHKTSPFVRGLVLCFISKASRPGVARFRPTNKLFHCLDFCLNSSIRSGLEPYFIMRTHQHL